MRIDVAVGLVLNPQQEILIARRQSHQEQGDLWEFPGGKREQNEIMFDTLKRELMEEVGIEIIQAQAFQQINHHYGEKQIGLDVWLVEAFDGEAYGREGQQIRWVKLSELEQFTFPAANKQIIDALLIHFA